MGYVQELVYGRIKHGKSNPNFGHWFGDEWNGDPHPTVSTDPSVSEPKKPRQTPKGKKSDSAGVGGSKKSEEGKGESSGMQVTFDGPES